MEIRTDLALEAKEKFEKDNVEVKGVVIEEKSLQPDLKLTFVKIETENGAKIMGKPKGIYVTLDAPQLTEENAEYHQTVAQEFANVMKKIMPVSGKDITALIVGLGNREVTPDSLGPRVVDEMSMNRHLIKEYGRQVIEPKDASAISGMVPGVMAQTGMESSEMIRGVIRETNPDLLVVVDALAARSTKRLNRTIQISDAGIAPGSGVGNHRQALNQESMGIPVISIGVPMVVDAVTIVNDAMWNLLDAIDAQEGGSVFTMALKEFKENEKQELIRELLSPGLNTMFVTPKDIDESVRILSKTVAKGIHLALQ